ncbi:mechanosensitive ion channel family protein [Polymorphobacter sp. PAMC 29334]|uniref:mechanosensitive ion channel family protein n=1 Tax=Polymorphobacter sp. PAMC 29334 TaxID=2862331 RepID=UPI001D01D4A7|nr:mechanosensitive ion channel family protein [Polymorphobacter sp. PAMC 29334]
MTTTPHSSTGLSGDLLHMPAQVERLTSNTIAWLQTDSVAALIGIGSAVVIALVLLGIRFGICRLLGTGHDVTTWQGFIGRMVRKTRTFFIGALAAEIAVRTAAPPGALLSFIKLVFTVSAAIQGAIWVREFILGLVDRRAAFAEDKAALASAGGIIRVLVNVVVWSLAFILVLDNLGVNVTALVAGLGVGGIAIGLAAQGIFADLFAALAILFDRPFRVGDTIRWGSVTGKVEAIGLKTVRIRSQSGEQVVVGNTKLLGDQISNLARIEERQVIMVIGVTYQTSSELLESIPSEIETIVNARPECRFDRCHFVRFADSSLDFEIAFFSAGQSFKTMMDARHAIGLAILRRFNELGIDFAYPTQVALTGRADGRVIDPPVAFAIPPQGATG